MERAIVLALVLSSAGCLGNKDAHHPGTKLGTFHVDAAVTANSCGQGALGESDAWAFDVLLSRGDRALYWDNGHEIITGSLGVDEQTFAFESAVEMNMRDMGSHAPACSVRRTDGATGELDAATADVTGFKGTLAYSFAATSGSDCGDLDGVVFESLPCAMEYSLDAIRTAGP